MTTMAYYLGKSDLLKILKNIPYMTTIVIGVIISSYMWTNSLDEQRTIRQKLHYVVVRVEFLLRFIIYECPMYASVGFILTQQCLNDMDDIMQMTFSYAFH